MRIGVIGAGMGGLALAAALRQAGIDVEVYEQASKFARVGAGIHLAPNATRALLGLGLRQEAIESKAYRPKVTTGRDAYTGDLLVAKELDENAEAPHLTWHRGDLHEALLDLVPDSTVHRGRKLTEIETVGDEVSMSFADGTTATADAVVAADGVHSTARSKLLHVDPPVYTGRVAYRAVIPAIDGLELDPVCKWWGTDRHFVHYYVNRATEMAFTTSVPEDNWSTESWSAQGDVEVLKEAFAEFHPNVRAILDTLSEVHRWPIHSREPLATWSQGRVVLLGDSCHTMPPYMGLGAAMAMEDAVAITRCLVDIDGDTSRIPEAFDRYERSRKPRTTETQRRSEENDFGRTSYDAAWAYEYDAWTAELEPVSVAGGA